MHLGVGWEMLGKNHMVGKTINVFLCFSAEGHPYQS